MDEIVLNDFTTFEEISNGYLLVKENSNLYYVIINNEKFIARAMIDLVTMDNINEENKFKCIIKYFDVLTGNVILTSTIIEDTVSYKKENLENLKIVPLSSIIDNNKKLYKEDIYKLVDYSPKTKVYNNN